jgi:ATP-dependent Clp protease ATP-binding subunit ClpA
VFSKLAAKLSIQFSPKAENALRLALDEARRLRQSRIGLEQVLIGLIAEDKSIAGQILKSHGVTLRDAKQALNVAVAVGNHEVGSPIPISGAVENLFAQALDLQQLGELHYLTTDRLLLSILDEKDRVLQQVLAEMYVDIEKLRSALLGSVLPPTSTFTPKRYVLDPTHKGFERFSKETMAALLAAQAEAFRLGQSRIGSELLLFGICDERTSAAAEALKKLGVKPGDLQALIERTLSRGNFSGTANEILLTLNAHKTLLIAFDAAIVLGDEIVTPVHLLASILVQSGDFALPILTILGVNIEKLESLMLRSMIITKRGFAEIAGDNIEAKKYPPVVDRGSKKFPVIVDRGPSELIGPSKLSAKLENTFQVVHDPEQQPLDFGAWRYSFKAMRAMICAEEEARKLKRIWFGSSEILLGLMAEGTGIAALVLRLGKLRLAEARVLASRNCSQNCMASAGELPEDISLDKDGSHLVEAAKDIAVSRGESHIRTGHLLLAILESENSMAREILGLLHADIWLMKKGVTELLDQQTGRREVAEGER